jgi:hypothetical protein
MTEGLRQLPGSFPGTGRQAPELGHQAWSSKQKSHNSRGRDARSAQKIGQIGGERGCRVIRNSPKAAKGNLVMVTQLGQGGTLRIDRDCPEAFAEPDFLVGLSHEGWRTK